MKTNKDSIHSNQQSKYQTDKLDSSQLSNKIAHLALDKKAIDTVVYNISKKSGFSDYVVICSALSERQAQAIANNIIAKLKELDIKPLGVEGLNLGQWVLIDYVNVVVNIFSAEQRKHYDLDDHWQKCPHTNFSDNLTSKAKFASLDDCEIKN